MISVGTILATANETEDVIRHEFTSLHAAQSLHLLYISVVFYTATGLLLAIRSSMQLYSIICNYLQLSCMMAVG